MTRKSILIIAFHFPPFQGSSGLHRTLSWARHLSNHDWDVTVLTASSFAYRNVRDENLSLIPKNVKVIRAPALDTTSACSPYPISTRAGLPLAASPDGFTA